MNDREQEIINIIASQIKEVDNNKEELYILIKKSIQQNKQHVKKHQLFVKIGNKMYKDDQNIIWNSKSQIIGYINAENKVELIEDNYREIENNEKQFYKLKKIILDEIYKD